MFFNKKFKVYYPNKKRVTINSFSGGVNGEKDELVRSIGYAEASYNFNVQSGALTHGEGVNANDTEFIASSRTPCQSPELG